jgi:hypothetical protein
MGMDMMAGLRGAGEGSVAQAAKQTVVKRTLVTCLTSDVGPGCGKRWLELGYERHPVPVGYGMYARVEHVLRLASGFDRPGQRKCPTCGGRCVSFDRLEVKKSHGGSCLNSCQVSDSKKCACACGGKKHGWLLDPAHW